MHAVSAPEVSIPLSKGKVVLLILGSIGSVLGSTWIWSIAETHPRYNPLYVKCVAVAGGSFFGICGIAGCIKFFDDRPGLIIDGEGIVDNSSAVSAGRIHWNEITALRVSEIAGQRFVTIDVVDPQKYIERCGFFVRLLNQANTSKLGSPINISPNSLKVEFGELVQMLTERFERYSAAD